MRKVQLLLAAGDGATDGLTDLLLDQFSFVREQPGGIYRLALRDAASRAVSPDMGVPEFDAVLELGVPDTAGDEPLLAAAARLGPQFAPLIDGARSAIVLGQEIEIVPGEGEFELFRCMSRKPGLTLEQFSDHWLTIHSQFGRAVPGHPGYRQLHRDPDAQTAAGKAAGIAIDTVDGVATLHMAGTASVGLLGSDPEQAKATAADGALFVDRSKAMGMIARVVVVAGPLP
ncbi:MAG TPA: EthD domain-containing protein [Thermomicrobiales bacterium]|nr:EthD domain-containing protein [Thermomicrobiales bacterium]